MRWSFCLVLVLGLAAVAVGCAAAGEPRSVPSPVSSVGAIANGTPITLEDASRELGWRPLVPADPSPYRLTSLAKDEFPDIGDPVLRAVYTTQTQPTGWIAFWQGPPGYTPEISSVGETFVVGAWTVIFQEFGTYTIGTFRTGEFSEVNPIWGTVTGDSQAQVRDFVAGLIVDPGARRQ
jgi:hypothetical protein